MKPDAWHLPWDSETTPHALLDILRGCNISCSACYNERPASVKSVSQIESELQGLMALRRLDSISLVGGEVLLHPRLCEIVRLVKDRGLTVDLFTNGLLLDDRMLADLKASGLDMMFLHIDRGQSRPDLPDPGSSDLLRELWEAKTRLVARHGIDAGLTMTAFGDRITDIQDIVAYVVDSPHVNYLLVTLFRDTAALPAMSGDLRAGLRSRPGPARTRTDTLTNGQVGRLLADRMQVRPFCYLGSNVDPDDPRWLSYLVGTRHFSDGRVTRHALRASGFEKACLALSLRLTGKYLMYRPPHAGKFVTQVLLNGLMGGDFIGNMRFLIGLLRPGGRRVGAKRLLFQCPADVAPDGTVVHCSHCPDAVLKDGKLVPVCIADKVES